MPLPTHQGERALIRALRAAAARIPQAPRRATRLTLGIGDDCAIITPHPSEELLLTTDLFLETVHFRRDWHAPEAAGHRCLARGLSDIAAMGGRPVAFFLSLALPSALPADWASRFLDGLLRLARHHRVPLAGGDTAQAPGGAQALFSADIIVLGAARRGRALRRCTARPGDLLYVTGALGGAAAELAETQAHPRRSLTRRTASGAHPHLFPQPRLAVAQALAPVATAAIDVSDGLSTDLSHLCEESRLAAVLHASALPIHPLAQETKDPLALALHGGEDYELLFTAPPRRHIPKQVAGIAVTCIGQLVAPRRGQARLALLQPDGTRRRIPNAGWQHLTSTR